MDDQLSCKNSDVQDFHVVIGLNTVRNMLPMMAA